jgi:DNA-directed RNA polymerase subunit F
MKIISKKTVFLTKREVLDSITARPVTDDQNLETMRYTIQEYCKDSQPLDRINRVKGCLKEKKLTEFEIYQLLDIWPKSLLCLQLVIEEMEERFTEDELNEILDLFKN